MSRRLLLVLLLFLALASPVTGQSRFELSVTPALGGLDPSGAMPHARILSSALTTVSYDDLATMTALGVALHVDDTRSPLGLRLGFLRSFGGEETGQWGCLPPADGGPAGCPSILIRVPTDVTVTSASASLVGRLPAGPIKLQGDVGAGWVRHAYTWPTNLSDSFSLQPGAASRNAATVHLGAGAHLPMGVLGGGVALRYEEIRALSGASEGRTDRWRALTVGVELPLFR